MTNLIIVEHNTETNEIIEREMTKTEAAEHAAAEAEREAAATAKATDKAALLAKLGITAEEAALLLS